MNTQVEKLLKVQEIDDKTIGDNDKTMGITDKTIGMYSNLEKMYLIQQTEKEILDIVQQFRDESLYNHFAPKLAEKLKELMGKVKNAETSKDKMDKIFEEVKYESNMLLKKEDALNERKVELLSIGIDNLTQQHFDELDFIANELDKILSGVRECNERFDKGFEDLYNAESEVRAGIFEFCEFENDETEMHVQTSKLFELKQKRKAILCSMAKNIKEKYADLRKQGACVIIVEKDDEFCLACNQLLDDEDKKNLDQKGAAVCSKCKSILAEFETIFPNAEPT